MHPFLKGNSVVCLPRLNFYLAFWKQGLNLGEPFMIYIIRQYNNAFHGSSACSIIVYCMLVLNLLQLWFIVLFIKTQQENTIHNRPYIGLLGQGDCTCAGLWPRLNS